MIKLHKLNNEEFVLNYKHIEIIEERPDTTITLTNEKKYLVKEPIEEIVKMIIEFEKNVFIEFKTNMKFKGD